MHNILSPASQAHKFAQFVVYIYIVVTSTTLAHLEEPQSYPIIHLPPSFGINSLHTPVKTSTHPDDYQLDNFMQVIDFILAR